MRFTVVYSIGLLILGNAHAGSFLRPFESGEPIPESDPAGIIHPEGYTGVGGVVSVGVCILPDSQNASEMVVPTENAVRTWNNLNPVHGNFIRGSGSGVTGFDYESVLVHEIGHCIGLDHTNLATESEVSSAHRDYSRSGNGTNDSFDLDDGADDVIGSADDVRGDDVNVNWFERSVNNPFAMASVVDKSTYSVSLNDLPPSHSFVANGTRNVASLLGYPNTEAVMNQGTYSREAQRDLSHDDVATLRLGMSGADETQGTPDDYVVVLTYHGIRDDNNCDIRIRIDPATSNFAFCSVRYSASIAAGHRSLRNTNITLSGDFNWFFNQTTNAIDSDNDLLSDAVENAGCTDAFDADTDDDGLSDGAEDANHNGSLDVGETDPCDVDSDQDGVQDGTESGVSSPGPDTDSNVFIADADPASTTSPLLSDTDADSYSDGEEDLNANGRVDANESDPEDSSSTPIIITVVPWWSARIQLLFAILIILCVRLIGLSCCPSRK